MLIVTLALASLLQAVWIPQASAASPESSCPSSAPLAGRAPSLVSDDDYPAEALARGEQGTTCFSLVVGVNGRVRDCIVTRSSGSASLDGATCRIMRERARFRPARRRNGEPTEDVVHLKLTWRIADEAPIGAPPETPQ